MAILGDVLDRVKRPIEVDDEVEYKCVGVKWYGLGTFIREQKIGLDIVRKNQWLIKKNDVVYNKLFAWKGAFAIANNNVECIVSDKFPTYIHNPKKVHLKYLEYFFQTKIIADQAEELSKGAAAISKLTLNPPDFLKLSIPLPDLDEQQKIIDRLEKIRELAALHTETGLQIQKLFGASLYKSFHSMK